MQRPGLGENHGLLVGVLEIAAVFHELSAKRAHGGIFLATVALRHDQHAGKTGPRGGKSYALAVIPTSSSNNTSDVRIPPLELFHVDDAAAYLECPDRGMIFVLKPDVSSSALREQRPADLRCRRHHLMHQIGRRTQRIKRR